MLSSPPLYGGGAIATWIFRGDPDRLDIDGYLKADLGTISWEVGEHPGEVVVGDTVFLWRGAGQADDLAGVVAECRVASAPEHRRPDAAFLRYWKGGAPPTAGFRADLIVVRVANRRQVIRAN